MGNPDAERSTRRARMLREQLHTLATRYGFLASTDRQLPGVDHPTHFMITPTRVYVMVERPDQGEITLAKTGEYPAESGALLIGDTNCTKYVSEAQAALGDTRLIIDTPGVPFTPTVGMLVLPNIDLSPSRNPNTLFGIQVHGLRLIGAFRHEHIESTDRIADLTNLVERAFPAIGAPQRASNT